MSCDGFVRATSRNFETITFSVCSSPVFVVKKLEVVRISRGAIEAFPPCRELTVCGKLFL